MMRLKVLLLTLVAIVVPVMAGAQTDDEYRLEIGAGMGTVSYLGDFNGNPLRNNQPLGSLSLRRTINPYMALKLAMSVGTLKGSTADVDTWYPELNERKASFSNTLTDLSLTYEYNFWPYGTGQDYRGAKRLTPFISIGIGATYVKADENVLTANIPLGVGLKCKVAKRLNLGLEWTAHFSLSDKLDGVKDPYKVKSKGVFKNTDCYSVIQLTLTYSFLPKCLTCNKDE